MSSSLTVSGKLLVLRDGRRLAYEEHGDISGEPILLFHGAPGSRAQRHPDESIARELGVRVITVDRPGVGLSDRQPGRRLLDWPDDVEELASALGLGRFAVFGMSCGGPYALACAYKIPHRLTTVALASSAGPCIPELLAAMKGSQRQMFALAAKAPWLLRLMFWWMVRTMPDDPKKAMAQFAAHNPVCDAEVVRRSGMLEMTMADFREAFRQGARGCVEDLTPVARPWGFRPEEIIGPVHLWHGDRDENVPVATGEYLARAIPNARLTLCPGEGHLLFLNHWPEILAAVSRDAIRR